MKKMIALSLTMLFCCICLSAFAAIPSFLNAFPENADISVCQPLFKDDPVPFPTVELEVDEKSGMRTYTISGLEAWGVPRQAFCEYKFGGMIGFYIPDGSPTLDDQVRMSMAAGDYKKFGFSWNHSFGNIERTGIYENDYGAYVLMMQTKTGAIRICLDGSQVSRSYSVESTSHYLNHDGGGYLIDASSSVKQEKQTLSFDMERVHPRTHAIEITQMKIAPAGEGQSGVIWYDDRWVNEFWEPIEAPDGIDPTKPPFELTNLPEETPADTQLGVIDFSMPTDGLHDQWPLAAPLPAKPEMFVALLPDGRIGRTFTGLVPWGLNAEEWGVWEYQMEDDSWLHTQTAAEETLTLILPDSNYYNIALRSCDPANTLSFELYNEQFRISAWSGSLSVTRDYDGFCEICYPLSDDFCVEATYGDGLLIAYRCERYGKEDFYCSIRFEYDAAAENFTSTDINLDTADGDYKWSRYIGWMDGSRSSIPQPEYFDAQWFEPLVLIVP